MIYDSIPETLVITYLEMTRRTAFRPVYLDESDDFTVLRMEMVDVPFYRFLYRTIGESWRWRDRLLLPDDELHRQLSNPAVTVDTLYVQGVPAGYVELVHGKSTELAYFGLRPAFTGRGLGKHLLSWGVAQAWSGGAERIWVHTCNLDSPHALDNYLKRGFTVYKVTEEPMPERYY